jgi:hypothetical protein
LRASTRGEFARFRLEVPSLGWRDSALSLLIRVVTSRPLLGSAIRSVEI